MDAMEKQLEERILMLVRVERVRQFKKWGNQNHTNRQWESIFNEEYAEALCKIECGYHEDVIEEELIHAISVLVGWIRDLRRLQRVRDGVKVNE